MDANVNKSYFIAVERYAGFGIDTNKVIEKLKEIPISIHAWQLDDVSGFEEKEAELSGGGILSTGDFPGKAKNIEQLWQDLEKVLSLVPGGKKISLQSIQGDYKGNLSDRSDISTSHFNSWIDWAKEANVGIDLNPALYSHPKAGSGYTLSSKDKNIRSYWIEYVKKVRYIANYIGDKLNTPCISTLWIPDGSKDVTPSRYDRRINLKESLDAIYSVKYLKQNIIDSVESKLFGIGLEYFTVGSLEFYLSYAVKNGLGITLDTGHFHPTEVASDKISSILPYLDDIVLHLSRGIRWDSDHVTTLSEELIAIMQEIIRADVLGKIHIGTDFFDGSINRVGALVTGARAVQKALLIALLEPTQILKEYEGKGNNFGRLALLEDLKALPFGDVWNYYCELNSIPKDLQWIDEVLKYEKEVILKR